METFPSRFDFLKWLYSVDNTVIFQMAEPDKCPLAYFLWDTTPERLDEVSVYKEQVTLSYASAGEPFDIDLPLWAIEFVEAFDMNWPVGTPVSVEELIKFLSEEPVFSPDQP